MNQAVKEARELLDELTPLKRDCGRLCGARCCRSLEGEETGMVLFPGEEEAYTVLDGWKLRPVGRETEEAGPENCRMIAVCPGKCVRAERPLSCRLFPLIPEIRKDGTVQVRMDLRARAVCPLSRQGVEALDPDFSEAVRQAGVRLAADPEAAAVLQRLTVEQEQLRELRRKWGR